jgi:hypothetical protein
MNIFFFGGYESTYDDVDAWAFSVDKKLPEATAIGWAYPEGALSGNPLATWKQEISEQIGRHVALTSEWKPCIIVGHSSGCAIANDIAEHALAFGAENFRLIALDGFRPNDELLALPGTAVWSAECGDARSLNYDGLKDCERFKVYEANVRHQWPLHFSLVNLNVSDDHVAITDGYRNCDANLDVLGLQ